jgi:ribosomal protein S3
MYAKNGVDEAIRQAEQMDIREIKEHNGEIIVVTGRPGRVIGAKGAMYNDIRVVCGPFKVQEALSKTPLDEITDSIIMHCEMDGHYYE